MIPVTTITKNASQDNLTEQDHRDIFEELRQQHSLRDFVALAKSTITIAQWSRYERGEWTLTRAAKNDLRRAVGVDVLPPTIAESVADVDGDAEVIEIGDGDTVRRVLKLRTSLPLSISANGVVAARLSRCTGRTRPVRRRLRRDMSERQAAVWDALTDEQRNERLGL